MKKLIVVALLLSGALGAQTAQEILATSGNAFRDHEYLSMEVAVYNYATSSSGGMLLGRAEMHKSPEGYYSRFMEDEMISNNSCTVILNHGAKSMVCLIGEKQKRRNPSVAAAPDSLIRPGDSLVYVGLENGNQHVIVYHTNYYFARTELFISTATSLPSRIIYYHTPANEEFTTDAYKTELLYEKVSFEEPDKKLFNEEKYIEKKNGNWIATPAYKNYKLTVSETPKQ